MCFCFLIVPFFFVEFACVHPPVSLSSHRRRLSVRAVFTLAPGTCASAARRCSALCRSGSSCVRTWAAALRGLSTARAARIEHQICDAAYDGARPDGLCTSQANAAVVCER
jgi:hypothetical protein